MVEYIEGSGWQVYDVVGLKKKIDFDFYLQIAQGDITGYLDYSAFGINPLINTGTTPEDIWYVGGIYIPPTTYRIHNISSSSANDTAAGTGMRTATVYGVVSTGLASEIITFNGVATVSTVNSYSDIYLAEGLSWGSSGVNQGNISIVAQTDATTTAYIPIGNNATKKAIRLIPPGYTGYVYDFQAGMQQNIASSSADVYFLIKTTSGWIPKRYHSLSNSGNSVEIDNFKIPLKVPSGTWVKIQCTSVSNNNTLVQGTLTILLIKN